jgi:hypothetical protein
MFTIYVAGSIITIYCKVNRRANPEFVLAVGNEVEMNGFVTILSK